ncbi:Hypothetical protein POVN_LOCUS165 [uncultured virus]|nr:Hypothetical protein POVN_LOCUS165 [uncultured virus]
MTTPTSTTVTLQTPPETKMSDLVYYHEWDGEDERKRPKGIRLHTLNREEAVHVLERAVKAGYPPFHYDAYPARATMLTLIREAHAQGYLPQACLSAV